MKLETQYNREGVEVVTHQAYFSSERQCVIKYDDPLEALDDAAAMLESAVGFMRNKYELSIADAEVPQADPDLIDAWLYPAQRRGDTYYITRVPRNPPPHFVKLDGRTFQLDSGLPLANYQRSCRYSEVDVYEAQGGSGGTLG